MFREFAQKSGIRGFTYADTDNKYAKLMWYAIMCVCTGLTISDVYGTFRYFLSYPTTTKVVLINNRSIDFGSPTISIPYGNPIENLKNLTNGSVADVHEVLDSVKHWYVGGSEVRNVEELQWPTFQTALSLIAAVVSSVTRAEHFIINQTQIQDLGWGYVSVQLSNQSNVIFGGGTKQVEFAFNWLVQNGISVRQATKTTVKLLCILLNFNIVARNQLNGNCETIEQTYLGLTPGMSFGVEFISFQIPAKLFSFSTNIDTTKINFRHPQAFLYEQPNTHISLDFSQDPTQLFGGENSAWQTVGSRGTIKITISAYYKQMDRQKLPCSKHFPSLCYFNCRKEVIKQLCNCQPLDLSLNKYELKECSVESFSQVSNTNCSIRSNNYVPDECRCYPKCERPSLSFVQASKNCNQDCNETAITIFVDTFNFPIFEELPLLESKQILGSLGGNLSLYLGVNFMMLYFTAFYWVSAAFAKIVNRKQK